jgi:hypothetical protein
VTNAPQPLRVTHCPVNIAGIPWENVQALRRKGVDARLVVFERGKLHPRPTGRSTGAGPLPASSRSSGRLRAAAPATDVFHFYFGLTLIPKSLQFPLLRALRKKSVFHYLGSDIRGKTPAELAFGKRADAEIVGSYDAIRWVPEAHVIPPGLDLREFTPRPPSDNPRPLVVHAPSNRAKKGTQHVIDACAQLPVDLDIVEGVPHDEARALRARRHRRRPAERRLARRLRARVDGARQAGRHLPQARRGREERGRLRRPDADRARDEGDARRRAAAPRREPGAPPRDRRARAAPTSSRCTTSTASPTACSTSTRSPVVEPRLPDEAPRAPLGDLRARRDRLADPRDDPAAALHALPAAEAYGQVEIVTAATAVLAIVLQLGISSAFFRFYFDTKDPAAKLTSSSARRSGSRWAMRRSGS